MTEAFFFSDDASPFGWSEASSSKLDYGPKGAVLATLPRAWTPPFALVAANVLSPSVRDGRELAGLGDVFLSRVRALADPTSELIVRSSIIGESIWDRGSYQSIVISTTNENFPAALSKAAASVLASAAGKQAALVIQRYVRHRARGEFGNLLRVSKTRDHWELSIETAEGATSRSRLNTQRDEAAPPGRPLEIKPLVARERLFGSVAAWLNTYLLRGRPQRVNCEWISDDRHIYIVQIDEEDEDFAGPNPFQLRVTPAHRPIAATGSLLRHAEGDALRLWDKLRVLEDLWEPEASHKPTLFYVTLEDLVTSSAADLTQRLESDFRTLIGADDIIVRTSVRAGEQKVLNLPRTESVSPVEAAAWCLAILREFRDQGADLRNLAFVSHRFIGARASAWIRAAPDNAIVEIHSLWGLPDALQYCPYDIWEVHVPTETATDYPDYKSNILIPREHGGWEYVRVKNELARSLSVGRREAIDLAIRTLSIARRVGRACHVMWFVGCVDDDGTRFSIPWYWTEGHLAEKNLDRSNYKVFAVSDPASLDAFACRTGSRSRQAIELKPTNLDLMRDSNFIKAVGATAKTLGIPVILHGSTLAHAYYQLRGQGCTVVTPGEKDHSRIRRSTNFGKLVRDKIPTRIAQRQEADVTRKLPRELIKGFLTSKLLEEALEVRSAQGVEQKVVELADLYEVVRALAHAEDVSLADVVAKADEKKGKTGGFDEGLVLLQTAILGRDRTVMHDIDRPLTQVLARRISGDEYEIPFSFFGFMELDQSRSLVFDDLGVRLEIALRADRIELRIAKGAEQLELPLDRAVSADDDEKSKAQSQS